MLDEHGVEYRYREYRKQPLSVDEIRTILGQLDKHPRDLLRRNDRANRELGLDGSEPADRLIRMMAEHPTLVQRPIGLLDGRAVIGRPVENLLRLLP